MTNPDPTQLDRLERRIERLTSVVIIQSVLLAAVVLLDVLQLAPLLALVLLIALPLLVFYRHRLPAVGRWIGEMIKRIRGTSGPVPAKSEERTS